MKRASYTNTRRYCCTRYFIPDIIPVVCGIFLVCARRHLETSKQFQGSTTAACIIVSSKIPGTAPERQAELLTGNKKFGSCHAEVTLLIV